MKLPFRTTVCGIEELAGHTGAGVSHVLSILDPGWPVPNAFWKFGDHYKLELRFDDVIEEGIPGTVPPRQQDVAEVLAFGRGLPEAAGHLLVHCHAGVSRSTASMALILAQAAPGTTAEDILGMVLRIRPQAWPNLRIMEFGDALLDRGGTLIDAAHALYHQQRRARPEFAAEMRACGRGREVDGRI